MESWTAITDLSAEETADAPMGTPAAMPESWQPDKRTPAPHPSPVPSTVPQLSEFPTPQKPERFVLSPPGSASSAPAAQYTGPTAGNVLPQVPPLPTPSSSSTTQWRTGSMRRAESDSPTKNRHGRSLRGGVSRSNSSQRGGKFDKRSIPPRPREERRSTGAERHVSHLIHSLEMVEMRSRQQSDEIHAASLSAVRSHTEAQHYLEAHNKLVVQTQAAILHESNKQAALHAEVAEARDSLGQTLQAHQQSTETVKSLQRQLAETVGEGSSLREQYDKLLSLFHQATDVAKERDATIDGLKRYNEQLVRQVQSCEVAQSQMNAQMISSQTDSREAYTTIERQMSLFRREQEVWQRNYNSEVQMLTRMCSEAETMRLEMIDSQRVQLKLEAELQQSLLAASSSPNPDCKRKCTQEELAMSKLRFEFAEEISQERTVCASATRHYEEHVTSTAQTAYDAQRARIAELEAQSLKLHADCNHLTAVNARMHQQATVDQEEMSD